MMDNLGTTAIDRGHADAKVILERVDRALASMGLLPHGSSRFAIHRRRLSESTAKGDILHVGTLIEIRRLQQALYELSQIDFVLCELSSDHAWRGHFEQMLGGHDVPWDDLNNLPRNIEYELYTAAIFHRAGFKVEPGEPDIRVLAGNWRVGVAAKRLASAQQLRRRLREGMDQIQKAKIPGLVAIDASVCFLERREVARPESIELGEWAFEQRLGRIADVVQRALRDGKKSQLALGAIVTAVVPCLIGDPMNVRLHVIDSRVWVSPKGPTDPRNMPISRIAKKIAIVRLA